MSLLYVQNIVPWRKVESWKCIHCGKCCSNLDVPVTYEDEKRLKKYGDVFTRGKIGLYLRKVGKNCIFYQDGDCKIYTDRPEACRRYPFYFRYFGSDEALFTIGKTEIYVYVDLECNGVGKGGNVEEAIKEILKSLIVGCKCSSNPTALKFIQR